LSDPVQKLSELLEDIATGSFTPDAPAGMQWRGASMASAAQPAPPAPAPPRPQAPQALGAACGAVHAVEQRATASEVEPKRRRGNPAPDSSGPGNAEQRLAAGPTAARPALGQLDGGAKFGYIIAASDRNQPKIRVHVALPIGQSQESPRRKTTKAVVSTPEGDCTNMCDFAIGKAKWEREPGFSESRIACAVCWSRASRLPLASPVHKAPGRAGAAASGGAKPRAEATGSEPPPTPRGKPRPPPGPPPDGLAEQRRAAGCNQLD